jgi:TPP-dependent pyruvate/acetoin dehydrogenase alpha subunit
VSASPRKTTRRAPAKPAAVPPEDLLQQYRLMLLIRRFEEKAGQLYGMGLIGGFCHLYIGQEAVLPACTPCHAPRMRWSPAIAITDTCSPAAWTPRG